MGVAGFDRGSWQLLKTRNFGVFAVGLGTSILGAEMAGVALVFAVLDRRGSLSDVSLVLAARILPMTLFLLGGGVIGDRYPRRYVLAAADSLRLLSQLGLALYFLAGAGQLWVILALCALVGFSEALFEPAYEGLIPELAPKDRLHDANALLGLVRSSATVAGPAIAGVLVAVTSPVVALLVCAGGYAVNVGAVLLLRISGTHLSAESRTSFITELRQGWTIFRSHTWLWTIAVQFAMFNLVVWAPFLVLGPAAAKNSYGGSGAWGAIIATYGFGAIIGGVAMLGRRPHRPLVVATIVTIGWAAPSAALAFGLPLPAVIVGALLAGVANTSFGTIFSTAVQQRIPADSLSRVRSYVMLGAFSMGPLGLAVAGPIAEATSIHTVLAVGVVWQLLANGVLLCTPVIRRFRPVSSPASDSDEADSGESRSAEPDSGERELREPDLADREPTEREPTERAAH